MQIITVIIKKLKIMLTKMRIDKMLSTKIFKKKDVTVLYALITTKINQ